MWTQKLELHGTRYHLLIRATVSLGEAMQKRVVTSKGTSTLQTLPYFPLAVEIDYSKPSELVRILAGNPEEISTKKHVEGNTRGATKPHGLCLIGGIFGDNTIMQCDRQPPAVSTSHTER